MSSSTFEHRAAIGHEKNDHWCLDEMDRDSHSRCLGGSRHAVTRYAASPPAAGCGNWRPQDVRHRRRRELGQAVSK